MAIGGFGPINFALDADTANNVYRTDMTTDSLSWDVTNLSTGTVYTITGLANVSGCTYDRFMDRIWLIRNDTDVIPVISRADVYAGATVSSVIRTITLDGSMSDTEGVDGPFWNSSASAFEYFISDETSSNYFVFVNEISESDLVGSGDLSPTNIQQLTLAAAGADNNSGAEGVSYDKYNADIWVAGEGEQSSTSRKVYKAVRPSNRTTDYTYTDAELTVTEPWDPEVEDMMTLYGATGASADISDVAYHAPTETLLWLSHTDDRLVQTDKSGVIQGTITLGGTLSQPEGVCFIGDDVLVSGEPNEFMLLTYSA